MLTLRVDILKGKSIRTTKRFEGYRYTQIAQRLSGIGANMTNV